MKTGIRFCTLLRVLGMFGVMGFVEPYAMAQPTQDSPEVSIHDRGDSVRELVWARRFELQVSYPNDYTPVEEDRVSSGWILVLRVDPELARRRDVGMPNLFVGRTIAERSNDGHRSGHVVVLVPDVAVTGATKKPARPLPAKKDLLELREQLAAMRIFFGSSELPERIDAARAAKEEAAAKTVGVRPVGEEVVAKACAGEPTVARVRDRAALYREVATLIKRYAPDESALAESYEQ